MLVASAVGSRNLSIFRTSQQKWCASPRLIAAHILPQPINCASAVVQQGSRRSDLRTPTAAHSAHVLGSNPGVRHPIAPCRLPGSGLLPAVMRMRTTGPSLVLRASPPAAVGVTVTAIAPALTPAHLLLTRSQLLAGKLLVPTRRRALGAGFVGGRAIAAGYSLRTLLALIAAVAGSWRAPATQTQTMSAALSRAPRTSPWGSWQLAARTSG